MRLIISLLSIILLSCNSASTEPAVIKSPEKIWEPKVVMETVMLKSGINVTLYTDSSWTFDYSAPVVKNSKKKKKKSTAKVVANNPQPIVNNFYSAPIEEQKASYQSSTVETYSGTCGARTKKGGSCKRVVKGGGRCWQH